MAKKQTRRCVSLNRSDYEAAKLEAARRGLTLVGLVETGLAAIGVPLVAHPKQTPALVQSIAARRAASMAKAKRELEKPRSMAKLEKPRGMAKRELEKPQRRPSRERQLLGDQVADAYGFQ